MYPNPHHAQMPPPQARSVAPETFLLDQDAQQSLPPDSVVALQQVDNRMCTPDLRLRLHPLTPPSQILSHLGAR
jgi:hypothetical protein